MENYINIDGEITQEQLEKEGVEVSSYAEEMLKKIKWTEKGRIDLVKIKVGELFEDNNLHTLDDIYKKAKDLGLELCPAEVAPHLRLSYRNQPLNEYLYVAMEPITDSDGDPNVFELARDTDELWLDDFWTKPTRGWAPDDEFVFCSRKPLKTFDTLDSLSLGNFDTLNTKLDKVLDNLENLKKVFNF